MLKSSNNWRYSAGHIMGLLVHFDLLEDEKVVFAGCTFHLYFVQWLKMYFVEKEQSGPWYNQFNIEN